MTQADAKLWEEHCSRLSGDNNAALVEALKPFAKLAQPKSAEPGAYTPIECIDTLYEGTGELRLSSHTGSSDRYEILWASDFQRAAEALASITSTDADGGRR